MSKKKSNFSKFKRNHFIRRSKLCVLAAVVGMLLVLSACGSKEAVLLEEKDLVQKPEVFDEGELAAQPEWAKQPEAVKQVEASTLFVHICGEVMEPGVYELPAGSRIFEAVEAAGGFTEAASTSYVNLAQELSDGWKVEIPVLGESVENMASEQKMAGSEGVAVGEAAGITADGISATGAAGSMAENGLVDINTATKQELCTLPGVGESRAESIISYREKNGGFTKIEDIMKVEGIKDGMFSKMKDKICVRGVK